MNVITTGQYELIDAEAGIVKAGGNHYQVGRPCPVAPSRMASLDGLWLDLGDDAIVELKELDYTAFKKSIKAAERAEAARQAHDAELVVKAVHTATVTGVLAQAASIGGEIVTDEAGGTACLLAPRGVRVSDSLLEAVAVLGRVIATEPLCGMEGCKKQASRITLSGMPLCSTHGGG